MANPFTRFILNQPDKDLNRFVQLWDALEERCITTYQAGSCTSNESRNWRQMRRRLLPAYRKVALRLAPHWKSATIKGLPLEEDPFLFVLQNTALEQVIGNWTLLQHLPPAREAINRCILDQR